MSNLEELEVWPQDRPGELEGGVRLRWVPGAKGEYAVTDDGRVFSYKGEEPYQLSNVSDSYGYSIVALYLEGDRIQKKVHQLVLRTFEGPCPEGKETRHLNGDPADNRIENLCWGTRKENGEDRTRHGTTSRGEEQNKSKLKESDVVRIRELYADSETTQNKIAEKFGIDPSTVSEIVLGKIWTHVGGPISERKIDGETKFTESEIVQIRERYDSGRIDQEELAEEFGVCQHTISSVVRGKTWSHVGGPTQ